MSGQQELEAMVEQVLIVDDHNHVLGTAPRSKMREQGLCHRATYIFVFNDSGQLHIQERTLNKDIYPGFFDPATGGVVTEGETYDQAAVRELAEELGIENTTVTPHFHFFFHNDDCQVWGRVYSCRYNGVLSLQKEEVAHVVFETPEEVLTNRHHRNYTPDSLAALERLVHCLRQI